MRTSGQPSSGEVLRYLLTRGVPYTHAVGIAANIEAESGFNPAASGDGGTSYGLFQHRGDRLAGLQKTGRADDWKAQVDYALQEPEATEYVAQAFQSPVEAAEWWTRKFERPRTEYADKRVRDWQSGGLQDFERRLQVAQAGTPDVPQGMFSQTQTPQVTQPPMRQETQMDDELLGGGAVDTLASNPWLLIGASILANNDSRNTGKVLGKGLLGGLTAYEALQQRRTENDLRRQQINAMQSPRSANITELEYLMQQGVPRDLAMRYAFSGQGGYGERYVNINGVPHREVIDQAGVRRMEPLTPDALGYRTQVLGTEERTKTESGKLGEQRAALRGEINKIATAAPSMIKQTDQLIADIEAGKYKDTGPISGRIKEYWSPELADLQFKATEQVLQNLQIVNLAPVTIKELELMGQLYAGAYKTPEQNLAVLRYLNARTRERLRRMRKLDAKLRAGGKIEDLPQWVEDEFDDFDVAAPLPDLGAAPAAPQVPVTVPQKPAGMPDDQWQEIQRFRQQFPMSGGR